MNERFKTPITKELLALRLEAGLSQSAAAEKCKFGNPAEWSQLESGKRRMNSRLAVLLEGGGFGDARAWLLLQVDLDLEEAYANLETDKAAGL